VLKWRAYLKWTALFTRLYTATCLLHETLRLLHKKVIMPYDYRVSGIFMKIFRVLSTVNELRSLGRSYVAISRTYTDSKAVVALEV
jgi:hypothetical protein